ncbi:MAG TPA: HAD-IA family hydrolase [bacterium]|nr:HAD-IA family hydrolase [bacterium]
MTRFDLVIFDLDGTLADTKRDLADATNHTLAELKLPTHSSEKVASFVGGGLNLLLQRALSTAGADADDAALLEKARSIFVPWYRDHMLDATRPYPGTEEMIARLAGAGVRMAIATNKPRIFTAGIVDTLFPRRFTPVVACGDDAPRKPDPTCVDLCRKAHPDVPTERILFVGDSLVDIDTARNARVAVASCSWGFGEREALAERKPEILVDVMPELAKAVVP